jgi:hypothetical protein
MQYSILSNMYTVACIINDASTLWDHYEDKVTSKIRPVTSRVLDITSVLVVTLIAAHVELFNYTVTNLKSIPSTDYPEVPLPSQRPHTHDSQPQEATLTTLLMEPPIFLPETFYPTFTVEDTITDYGSQYSALVQINLQELRKYCTDCGIIVQGNKSRKHSFIVAILAAGK